MYAFKNSLIAFAGLVTAHRLHRRRDPSLRRLAVITSLLAFACASLIIATRPARTAAASRRVTTTLRTQFRDTVFVSNNTTPEWVAVSGTLHHYPTDPILPPNPIRVHVNLSEASGVGQATGLVYQAQGSANVETSARLPGSVSFRWSYSLLPPSPILPPNPINVLQPMAVTVSYDSQGTATGASNTPSLISHWKGDGNAQDAMGLNPGTLFEPARAVVTSDGYVSPGVTFVPRKVGQAFGFQHAGYVEVADSASFRPAELTAMAWVRAVGSPGANDHVLSKGALQCVASSYALYTGASGGLLFYVSDGATYVESPDAGTSVWDGSWHLVAGTYDGATVRLFVDGVEVGSGISASAIQSINYSLADNSRLYIGAYRGTCERRFKVDEVRLFSRALSDVEVQSIYNSEN
jgi:Concanavalin A-like lectin/glucanases superfamily